MADKQEFDLARSRAENFGKYLEEAYYIMLDFDLEDKFQGFSVFERIQLSNVLETLSDMWDMWEKGQILVSSKEREQ